MIKKLKNLYQVSGARIARVFADLLILMSICNNEYFAGNHDYQSKLNKENLSFLVQLDTFINYINCFDYCFFRPKSCHSFVTIEHAILDYRCTGFYPHFRPFPVHEIEITTILFNDFCELTRRIKSSVICFVSDDASSDPITNQ